MHSFTDLADRAAVFAIKSLNEVTDQTVEALQKSGATRHVKNLQMARLSKIIFAAGMFSVFEAILQDRLDSENGFQAARELLSFHGEIILEEKFEIYYLAINVLKHGRGASYKKLCSKPNLPFRVMVEGEKFFFEGDVSEVSTLIDVDDSFIEGCGAIIREVSEVIQRVRPGTFL